MDKIGIYGGTFDPIHSGHLSMMKAVADLLALDRILVIPANVPPHKSQEDIAEGFHRYEMCRLACAQDSRLEVSDLELSRPGRSYTVDTVLEIGRRYPDSELYLLLGSDAFFSVFRWFGFEQIKNAVRICVVPRQHDQMDAILETAEKITSMGAKVTICSIPILPVSSTEIREAVGSGRLTDVLVPEAVAAYIRQHGLYGEQV
jgi:nicotinate-nucleotide adenylyltransferase